MNNDIIWGYIAVGLIAIVALSLLIIKKWRFIKAAEAEKQSQEKIKQQKREDAIESIKIIALCMIEEQVETSEGCIRIKVLLDHVAPELHDQAPFSIFSVMYDATEHMPTHGARKSADKALIRKLDIERFELERVHKDAIIEASKAIRDYDF
ncbi:DUF2489 domain-containing protein [Alkalimarinus alittae]|uniref:DUF2489 domain-containing protein n=1 Tax=Alkalimarinus alittae TaxID=2961619 RepID=A0ABY6N1B5_9ALTE|nr:DUF2489 domain-containing protein [Alkalimarinus alittae]UZE95903.1 DUF2489 domain-containing protein [Alkalimarinus alittae]